MENVPLAEVEAGVLAGDMAVVGGVVVEQGSQPHPDSNLFVGKVSLAALQCGPIFTPILAPHHISIIQETYSYSIICSTPTSNVRPPAAAFKHQNPLFDKHCHAEISLLLLSFSVVPALSGRHLGLVGNELEGDGVLRHLEDHQDVVRRLALHVDAVHLHHLKCEW